MSKPKDKDSARLLALAADLEAELDAIPGVYSSAGIDVWMDQMQNRKDFIEGLSARLTARKDYAGIRISNDWSGAKLTLAGIRATSTSGFESACRNWIARVRRDCAADA